MTNEKTPTPHLYLALTPVILTLLILGMQIFYFGVFEPHIPLAIGIALTGFVGTYLGLTWEEVRAGIFKVIHVALPSVSVLIVVGMIIGIWIASGTVPTIIYYGLKTLSPQIFFSGWHGYLRSGLCFVRHKLGQRWDGWACANGDWRRVRYTHVLDGRGSGLRGFFW